MLKDDEIVQIFVALNDGDLRSSDSIKKTANKSPFNDDYEGQQTLKDSRATKDPLKHFNWTSIRKKTFHLNN
jgi:hypothetical protein